MRKDWKQMEEWLEAGPSKSKTSHKKRNEKIKRNVGGEPYFEQYNNHLTEGDKKYIWDGRSSR